MRQQTEQRKACQAKTQRQPRPKTHWTSAPLSTNQQQKQTAHQLQELLEEENSFLLLRLTQMFGVELIEAKAQEALRLWQSARDEGASAYVAQPNGTRVAKTDGSPRSKGGVFFQVMREHCQSIGLNWYGVFPYQSQRKAVQQPSNGTATSAALQVPQTAAKPAAPKADAGAGSSSPTAPPNTPPTAKPVSAVQQPNSAATPAKAPSGATDAPAKPKPSRGKVTVTGTLAAAPKRDAEKGLVELVFQIEMTPTLPKGLPNLGTSRVTVICTIRQFEKLAETTTITPQTRFLVEGEPSPAVNRELQPFLKVVCLRLTTLDAEQARPK